jgi:hypothetical protein
MTELKKIILSGGFMAIALAGIFSGILFVVVQTAHGNNVSSQVTVGAATPVISGLSVNGGTAITVTAATTTPVNVVATITDANGCSAITGGTTTVLLYRSGVTSSTCMTSPNALNCYVATAFTATGTCSGGTMNTTTTFPVEYFAQATDASSSYPSQSWMATLDFAVTGGAPTSTADSAGVALNTLTAINVAPASINYGTITAGTNSGSTDQTETTANVGNSSTSLQVYAQSTLTSGPNTIATSSQVYATSIFTYPGASVTLGSTAATVGGFLLTSPTSTATDSAPTYWGISIPNGTPTGTYTGTTVFQSLFHS